MEIKSRHLDEKYKETFEHIFKIIEELPEHERGALVATITSYYFNFKDVSAEDRRHRLAILATLHDQIFWIIKEITSKPILKEYYYNMVERYSKLYNEEESK